MILTHSQGRLRVIDTPFEASATYPDAPADRMYPYSSIFSRDKVERRRTAEKVEKKAVTKIKVLRRRVKEAEKVSKDFDAERRATLIDLPREKRRVDTHCETGNNRARPIFSLFSGSAITVKN